MPKKTALTMMDAVFYAAALVLDSQEDGKLRVRFKATQANVINANLRLYPTAVLTDAIEESNKELVADGRMVGESPHPKHGVDKSGQVIFDTSIDNSVIKIYNQFIDDSGIVYVDAIVLDTAKGRDLRALIDAGIPVGISMRAVGANVRKTINNVMVDVATKLKIFAYDVVMNPATPGCEIVGVLTDSQVLEAMEDGPRLTNPVCPCGAGTTLQSHDPDNDGDVDFYYCPTCNSAFVAEMSQSSTTSTYTSESLRRVDESSWEDYDAARKYLRGKGITDALEPASKEDESEMTVQEILAAMKDNPEFTAMVDAIATAKATAITQPALDAIAAQGASAEALKVAEAAKAEARSFIDGRLAELKGKIADEAITAIADQVKEVYTKDLATSVIDGMVAVYSKTASATMLDSLGVNAITSVASQGNGQVRVISEAAPWTGQLKEMMDSFDRIAREQGFEGDKSIRSHNQDFVGKVMERFEKTVGVEALKDSVAFIDSVVNNDSVSVTTGQLLNQPSIQQALLIQAFQDVESLQFLGTDTFEGSEMRYPVETFTSAASMDPATGLMDMFIGEGAGIPESSINLSWQTYNPAWRRNAISLTTDVVNVLRSGPAKYDAIARALYHIAADKRRKLDNAAYLEMLLGSDEYAPSVITAESGVQADYVAGTGNVSWVYKLTLKGAATATKGSNPVVRPRAKKQIGATGQVSTVISNPFTITVSAATKVLGYLDASGNVAGGDYAVDWENGVIYFAASAGVVPASTLPVINYSAVTNYVRWSTTVPGGMQAEVYYNSLLQLITGQVQLMGSSPRFNRPNIGIMSLNASQYIENASMWYTFNSPALGSLTGGGTSNQFGNRSGVNFNRINAPWAAGDNRMLLTQRGATRYAIETPYQVEGPYPKYDQATGQIVDAKVYYGRENSLMATPQTTDTTGAIINPKSRSIKLVP